MMRKTASKPNALLIELLIVLLFFALSAVVILQVFMGARDKSVRSGVDSAALMTAEDIAERLYASNLDAENFFVEDGWMVADGHSKEIQVAGRDIRYVVRIETAKEQAGYLEEATLTAYDGDREVLTLPIIRYMPGEEAP